MKKIVLVGGGGHCSSVLDSILKMGEFNPVCITDYVDIGKEILGVKVIGDDSMLDELYNSGILYAFITVGSVGNPMIRIKIQENLKRIGFKIPSIIDSDALISSNAIIEDGVFVGKGAIVNVSAVIKKNAIINTGAIVEHDCIIGEFVHVAPGSTVSGGVTIGDNSHIGAGAVVIEGIKVGDNCLIGAGSVIIRDVESNSKICGNPGRKI
ncbi:acetyltransferase [Clostridium gasigenes]|uniref:Sugar O-acyltransferase, sialic acid O-acetyltransferase NeuD family n=2 Tax=Clostridium gasigenes TaxID=94869 RepID=A0A1H0TSH0_9CLOT|nr:acetyltransferase [Clostridium gasigenes]MBB6625563.1 acetyltransferase [Clostridium gasigenes]SDP56516.1 sugar O-acyltransferase, sialic acid O-acetyltransferase NeuD family [Clostridium gasigenes]